MNIDNSLLYNLTAFLPIHSKEICPLATVL
nr:MAG TPA: hypothetical protein [Caudoviricetes sp.]